MPIHKQATGHWDACTTHAAAARVVVSRILNRPAPKEGNERQGPRRHTMDIPTCQASRSHPRCKDAATCCFDHASARVEEVGWRDHLPAISRQCSGSTVLTRASRPATGASPNAHRRRVVLGLLSRKTHPPLEYDRRRLDRNSCQTSRRPVARLLASSRRLAGGE